MVAVSLTAQQLADEFVGAAHGDLRKVKDLLARQSSLLYTRATWDESALGAAAHVGQRDIAQFLLSVGAPMDICTASMLGMTWRVGQFLRADPALSNATGAHGLPALFHAALGGHVAVADLLVAAGANVAAAGNAALFGAIRGDQPAMLSWLLCHGADAGMAGPDGKTPLAVAQELGRSRLVELLAWSGGSA